MPVAPQSRGHTGAGDSLLTGRQLPVSLREAHLHEALLHLEEQITAALTPEIERIALGILVDG